MDHVMDPAFPCSIAATGLRRRVVSIVGAVLLFGSHPTVVRAEAGTDQAIYVAVDDPRPVEKAIESLMSRYGVRGVLIGRQSRIRGADLPMQSGRPISSISKSITINSIQFNELKTITTTHWL